MMAVPKRKTSKARRDKINLRKATETKEEQTGSLHCPGLLHVSNVEKPGFLTGLAEIAVTTSEDRLLM